MSPLCVNCTPPHQIYTALQISALRLCKLGVGINPAPISLPKYKNPAFVRLGFLSKYPIIYLTLAEYFFAPIATDNRDIAASPARTSMLLPVAGTVL